MLWHAGMAWKIDVEMFPDEGYKIKISIHNPAHFFPFYPGRVTSSVVVG